MLWSGASSTFYISTCSLFRPAILIQLVAVANMVLPQETRRSHRPVVDATGQGVDTQQEAEPHLLGEWYAREDIVTVLHHG